MVRKSSRPCENADAPRPDARKIQVPRPTRKFMSAETSTGFEQCSLPLRSRVFTRSARHTQRVVLTSSGPDRDSTCKRGQLTLLERHWKIRAGEGGSAVNGKDLTRYEGGLVGA